MQSPYNPTSNWIFGTPQNVSYQAGETTKVVHDKYNNKYYGQAKQSDIIKGLNDAIKRTQAQLTRDYETQYSNGWMGSLNSTTHYYTEADRKDQNDRIAKYQKDLEHINNGGYKQEGKDFFKSYDAYTGDWNNVFNRRKTNAERKESNRLQEIQNEKTRIRNKKIEGENQVRAGQAKQDTQISTGSKASAKSLNPRLEINTGISAQADKLAKSLNTGLSV